MYQSKFFLLLFFFIFFQGFFCLINAQETVPNFLFLFGQINVPSQTNITYTLTAQGIYWELDDENEEFPISENADLEEAFASITGSTTSNPSYSGSTAWKGFYFPWASRPYEYTDDIAYGFYKVTNSYNNNYFYIDIRDCKYDGPLFISGSYAPDFFIRFNYSTGKCSLKVGESYIEISSGELLSVWDIKNNGILPNTSFENFWSNALVAVNDGNNHPILIWGPYPSSSLTVDYYRVYRKYGSSSWYIYDIVSSDLYEYTDESVALSGSQSGTNVQYKVTAVYNTTSETDPTNTVTVNVQGGEIEKQLVTESEISKEYGLAQNYPNPFNPTTTISYSIAIDGLITLKLFDILGNEIQTLVHEFKQAGTHEFEFIANNIPSGIYFYQLSAGDYIATKKLILLK